MHPGKDLNALHNNSGRFTLEDQPDPT